MTRTDTQIRDLFDHWAQTYVEDVHTSVGILSGYTESLQIAADAVLLRAGETLLDIGIGTGGFAALLETQSAQVTGIDVSERMLERCAEIHPDYHLHKGSFTSIPLPDAHFDIVVSSFTFHEVAVADRGRALREVQRVLKKDGVFCVLDIMFASDSARDEAQVKLGTQWDDEEDYALIGELDKLLRENGFGGLQWRQTAPCHWVGIARQTLS